MTVIRPHQVDRFNSCNIGPHNRSVCAHSRMPIGGRLTMADGSMS